MSQRRGETHFSGSDAGSESLQGGPVRRRFRGGSTLHGIPRDVLLAHVMNCLTQEQRSAVRAVEVIDGGGFVNMGMNFGSVLWRAVLHDRASSRLSGTIPIRNSEIVS